jgi:hypothetical protein
VLQKGIPSMTSTFELQSTSETTDTRPVVILAGVQNTSPTRDQDSRPIQPPASCSVLGESRPIQQEIRPIQDEIRPIQRSRVAATTASVNPRIAPATVASSNLEVRPPIIAPANSGELLADSTPIQSPESNAFDGYQVESLLDGVHENSSRGTEFDSTPIQAPVLLEGNPNVGPSDHGFLDAIQRPVLGGGGGPFELVLETEPIV